MRVRVRFLGHSGFEAETGLHLLVFDAAGGLAPRHDIRRADRPAVFASHSHGDHFDPRIFSWRKINPAVRYILSDDIPEGRDAHYLGPGGLWMGDGLTVWTFSSTDQGVSFLVEASGVRIFHAGDLNDWHWKDESSPEEAEAAHAAFAKIISGIRGPLDIAFFPADPRQGSEYDAGARAFCLRLKPRHFFPMHYAPRVDVPSEFAKWAAANCPEVTVHRRLRPGQSEIIDL